MKKLIAFLDSIYFTWDSNEVLIFNPRGIPVYSYTQRNKIGKVSNFLIKHKIIKYDEAN